MSSTTDRTEVLKRVGAALRTLIRNIENVREEAAKSQKIHPTDLTAIEFLYRQGKPVSVKQLLSHMNLTSGSGTALIDRLEKAGFVRRTANPDDRRSWLVELDDTKAKGPVRRLAEMEQMFIQASNNLSDSELGKVADFVEGVGEIAAGATKID